MLKNLDSRSAYTYAHLIKALMLISGVGAGRPKIMRELGLNEASARTLLRWLEKNGIVRPSSSGHILTKKGARLVLSLRKKLSGPYEISESGITLSKYNVAYIVRGRAHRIRKGIEQRDRAVAAGAEGLTTIVFDRKFYMPGMEKWAVPRDIVQCFSEIAGSGDVILIGSAKSRDVADVAALSASLSLLD